MATMLAPSPRLRALLLLHAALIITITCDAFTAGGTCTSTAASRSHRRSRTTQPSSTSTALRSSPFFGVGSWDNDDFLDSLNGPPASAPADVDAGSMGGQPPQQQQQQQQQAWSSSNNPAANQSNQNQQLSYSQLQTHQTQPAQQQPTVSATQVGALPLGWSAHFDPASQQLYYYNVETGLTTWDKPAVPPGPPPSFASSSSSSSSSPEMIDALLPPPTDSAGLPRAEDADMVNAEAIPIDESIEGAELTEEMKARMKLSHTPDEEESGGGTKFRELLERAKKMQETGAGGGLRGRAVDVPQIPPELADRPIEEQAQYLQEAMWRQQHPEMTGRPVAQYQSPGIGYDGKKIGRNRDADIISNSADVYLAHLKRDSTSRNLARYAGDDARANEVFGDPSIQDIQGPEENPYLKERRERERNMLETVPEEMLVFQEYGEEGQGAAAGAANQAGGGGASVSGVSYREKLAQAQAKRRASST